MFEGQVMCSTEQTIRTEREHSAALKFTFGQVFNLRDLGISFKLMSNKYNLC